MRITPLIFLVFLAGCSQKLNIGPALGKGIGQAILLILGILFFIFFLFPLILGIILAKKRKNKKWLLLPFVTILILIILSGLSG